MTASRMDARCDMYRPDTTASNTVTPSGMWGVWKVRATPARATASAVDVDPGVWAGGAGGGSRGAHPVGPEDAMGEIDHRGNVDLGDRTFGENASEETQFAAILVADAGHQVLVQ